MSAVPSQSVRRAAGSAGWIGLSVLLCACAVGPDYVQPKTETPTHWAEAPLATADSLHLNDWWKTFNDPVLDHLIHDAILSNLDLKIAQTRIRAARASFVGTIAAGLPNIDARSNLMRRQNNANLGFGSGSNTSGGAISTGNQAVNIFQSGFDAAWEIDLFGGIRRAIESADANLETEEENQRDVLVTLLGEVARIYIDLRANQQLLAVTRSNLQSQEETLRLTRLRREAGLSSELEEVQSEGLTAETRSQAPVYETLVKADIHALSVLLGHAPGTLMQRLEPEGMVPVSSAAALADLPAALVQRRPDIRKAERHLVATNADIGVATAELYPKLNLTTFLGLQNTDITGLTPIGKSWSAAAALSTPIFNWGRIKANISAKEALNEQAFLSYQTTVLNAYKEVEDALVAHAQESLRIAALSQALEAQRLAMYLSTERWRKGLAAYLDVLLAERSQFQAQRQLVESQAKQSSQLVALYKALGGGWQVAELTHPPEPNVFTEPAEFIMEKFHDKQ